MAASAVLLSTEIAECLIESLRHEHELYTERYTVRSNIYHWSTCPTVTRFAAVCKSWRMAWVTTVATCLDEQGSMTLRQLDASVVSQAAVIVVSKLGHPMPAARGLALRTLWRMGTAVLESHAGSVVGLFRDDSYTVRKTAARMLGKLSAPAMRPFADAIAGLLLDTHASVVREAMHALSGLDHLALAPHAPAIMPMLGAADELTALAALRATGKLAPATLDELLPHDTLVQHSAALVAKLTHTN